MVMTDWMRSVQDALKTIPKNTPNRLGAAMKKAKLTYKKKGSSAAASSSSVMKKTFKRRRGSKGKGKGSRKSKRSRRPRHSGGAMSKLNPADYDGAGVGTSGAKLQLDVTNNST